jgi:iron complex transport system ATP-binding protein
MPAQVVLECRNLSCGYPGRQVLKGLSFSVQRGESVALLGVNGSGKSTLLSTINRLLVPLEGEVLVEGRNIAGSSIAALAKLVSAVPQEEPSMFPFRVREVVTMGRIAYGSGIFDTPEDRQAAESAMQVAECTPLADRRITELSGGERQRVLIARAIAQDTPLLLMDEPTSHLDASHQMATASLVRRLASEGRTVISAVHDLNLASGMATRALLISDGRLILDDEVERVLEDLRLDRAYGVKFERVRSESKRLLVVPSQAPEEQPGGV